MVGWDICEPSSAAVTQPLAAIRVMEWGDDPFSRFYTRGSRPCHFLLQLKDMSSVCLCFFPHPGNVLRIKNRRGHDFPAVLLDACSSRWPRAVGVVLYCILVISYCVVFFKRLWVVFAVTWKSSRKAKVKSRNLTDSSLALFRMPFGEQIFSCPKNPDIMFNYSGDHVWFNA